MIYINYLTLEKAAEIIVKSRLLINVRCRKEIYSLKNYNVLMTREIR